MRGFYSFVAAAIVAVPAGASGIHPFDRAELQQSQARNASTIVFVHASWCSTCKAQEAAIRKLLSNPAYRDVTVLTIDFDSQKPLWTSFGAQKQSTLIGFHGRRETARLAYDTDPQKIAALVASTLH